MLLGFGVARPLSNLQSPSFLTTFAVPVNMLIKKVEIPHWYLLYTNPRAEKKVELELRKRGFETFLPMHKTLKQWSDRKKWVEEPLFKSYVFVFAELERNFFGILNIAGVVKFVNFDKSPVVVDEREIELVKLLLGDFNEVESIPFGIENSMPGDEIEVIAGPLIGNHGKLLRRIGKNCILIELESIRQNILINMPSGYLRSKKGSDNFSNQNNSSLEINN